MEKLLRLDAQLDEGVEERLLLGHAGAHDVGDGAHENAAAHGFLKDGAEVDPRFIEVLRAVIEILRVNKDAHTLSRMFDNCHKIRELGARPWGCAKLLKCGLPLPHDTTPRLAPRA